MLLLSDLGDTLLLSKLTEQTVTAFYRQALAELTKVRTISSTSAGALPVFDQAFLLREMQIFIDWFVLQHLKLTLNDEQPCSGAFTLLADIALQQPQAGMHRDYHSRNLMLQPNGDLAVIDFQDVVTGPVTYDAVSLLKDCYIKWPAELVQVFSHELYQSLRAQAQLPLDISPEQFQLWFDWMGLQTTY